MNSSNSERVIKTLKNFNSRALAWFQLYVDLRLKWSFASEDYKFLLRRWSHKADVREEFENNFFFHPDA